MGRPHFGCRETFSFSTLCGHAVRRDTRPSICHRQSPLRYEMAPRYGRSKKRYRHEPQCGEFVLYAKVIFVTYTRSRIHGKEDFHESLIESVERSLASDWATHNVSARVFGSREWHENGVPHYHVAIEFSQKIYWPMARKMLSVWIIVDGRRAVDTQSIFIKKPKMGETNEKFLRDVQDYIAKEGDVFGQRIPDKERTGSRKRDPLPIL